MKWCVNVSSGHCKKIQDNYKKLVLTLEPGIEREFGGIQVVNVVDWLIEI